MQAKAGASTGAARKAALESVKKKLEEVDTAHMFEDAKQHMDHAYRASMLTGHSGSAIPPAPAASASTRISARLKRVQRHI